MKPDLTCVAKAITNGYFPFGAVMICEKIAAAFEENKDSFGAIGHGYTYSAHPVGAAAALACLPLMEEADVAGNAAARGEELLAGCLKLQDEYEIVGDVRGKGLMVALELVADRKTKKPIDKTVIGEVFERIYQEGVMVRVSGHNIILSPSLIVTGKDIARIVSGIGTGLATV